MNVPASFRQNTALQNSFQEFLPPSRKSKSSLSDSSTSDILQLELAGSTNPLPLNTSPDQDTSSSSNPIDNETNQSVTNEFSLDHITILRCVDKPSSSLPSRLTLSDDFTHSSVGFRHIDTMKCFLSQLYQDTIHIDHTPPDAVHDMGEFATLPKQPRNTTPVPSHFGSVVQMDIFLDRRWH